MQLNATSGSLACRDAARWSFLIAGSKPGKTFFHPFKNKLSNAGRNELFIFADSTPHLCMYVPVRSM